MNFESGGHPPIFLCLSFSSSGAGMTAALQHTCNDLKRQMCGLPIRKQPSFCNHLLKRSLNQCPMLHLAAFLISCRQSGNEWMNGKKQFVNNASFQQLHKVQLYSLQKRDRVRQTLPRAILFRSYHFIDLLPIKTYISFSSHHSCRQIL